MKIIITEEQYDKFIGLKRRLNDIIGDVSEMVDISNDFWGPMDQDDYIDFCHTFPTLKKFMKGIVEEICHQYRFNFDNIFIFIYSDIGYNKFIKILMDEHGEKIINYYNEKTKDC
jgi:hypothetical protein